MLEKAKGIFRKVLVKVKKEKRSPRKYPQDPDRTWPNRGILRKRGVRQRDRLHESIDSTQHNNRSQVPGPKSSAHTDEVFSENGNAVLKQVPVLINPYLSQSLEDVVTNILDDSTQPIQTSDKPNQSTQASDKAAQPTQASDYLSLPRKSSSDRSSQFENEASGQPYPSETIIRDPSRRHQGPLPFLAQNRYSRTEMEQPNIPSGSHKEVPEPTSEDPKTPQHNKPKAKPPIGERISETNRILGSAKSSSTDVDYDEKTAPAVTHETTRNEVSIIPEVIVKKEIHEHDYFHYTQPVKDTEMLPPKHFKVLEDGRLEEMSEEEVKNPKEYPIVEGFNSNAGSEERGQGLENNEGDANEAITP